MLCDTCKTKGAVVFLTQMIQGDVKKLNLCGACSKKQGLHEPMEEALANLFLGLGMAQEKESALPAIVCGGCGFSQEDFKKRGRLGCSACYDAFAESLTPMLRNMHRDVVHKGKVPAKIAVAHFQAHELEELQAALDAAIKSERYEEAVLYRDRLAVLASGSLGTQLGQEVTLQKKVSKKTSALKKKNAVIAPKLPKKKRDVGSQEISMKKQPPLLPPAAS